MAERQTATTLREIRADHRARYEWAAERLGARIVIDAGCGCGYGAWVLAEAGCAVGAWDMSVDAITYAKTHWQHERVHFHVGDVARIKVVAEAVVCFEVIEHVANPEPALNAFRRIAPRLLASVPNEDVIPFGPRFPYHKRHYTKREFEALLNRTGWRVTNWWGQRDGFSPVEPEVRGRTLVAECA